MQQQSAQPSPEEKLLHLEAQVQELDALAAYLSQRAAALNAEVRIRDARIKELEAQVAQEANVVRLNDSPGVALDES